MKERFSERARNAMALANLEASKLNHDYLAPFHLMLGILAGGECVATSALLALGVDPDEARRRVLDHVKRGESSGAFGRRAQTTEMKEVMSLAIADARQLEHHYIGTEHLLLAMSEYEQCIPSQVLKEMNVIHDALRIELKKLLASDKVTARLPARGKSGDFEWLHQQELAKAFRSPKFWHTLILAVDSADRFGAGQLEPMHLLLALLRDDDSGVPQLLAEKGVTVAWVREHLNSDQ